MGYIGAGISRFNTADELTVTGDAEFNANANFGDNDKVQLGASQDLQIYHDGSNSHIAELGTGNLTITGGGPNVSIVTGSSENMAVFANNGAVTLYYDNAAKIATTSTGIDVTGNATLDAAGNVTDGSGRPTVVLNNTSSGGWSTGTEYGSLEFHTDDTTSGAGLRAKISAKTGGTNGSRGVLGFTTRDSSGTTVETMTMDDTGINVTGEVQGDSLDIDSSFAGTVAKIKNSRGNAGTDCGLEVETSTTAAFVQRWVNAGTEIARVDADGKVGIGTDSPGDAKLYVQGGQVIARYDHTTTSLSGNTNLTAFPHSLAVYNGNGTGTGNLASIGFSIDTTGSVTNGAIVGHSTAAGSMDLAFYTESSNAIGERGRFLAGGGLTFNGDTAAANALDDYEEGTWTPTIGGTATYHSRAGYYIKIGKLVFITGIVHVNAVGTGATNNFQGLPYGGTTGTGREAFIGVQFFNNLNVSATYFALRTNGTQLYGSMQGGADGVMTVNPSFITASTEVAFAGCYYSN